MTAQFIPLPTLILRGRGILGKHDKSGKLDFDVEDAITEKMAKKSIERCWEDRLYYLGMENGRREAISDIEKTVGMPIKDLLALAKGQKPDPETEQFS